METQLKKGVLDICILAILNQKDCYGYELVETISGEIQISEGTLYPILRRLEKEGYLQKYQKESNKGPSRKYYRLTASGKSHLKFLSSKWLSFVSKVNRFLK